MSRRCDLAVKLDLRGRADGEVSGLADPQAGLSSYGHRLQPLDIMPIQAGYGEFISAPDYLHRGPGVSTEATLWLHDQGVRVMGIDAWGWDAPLIMQAEQAHPSGLAEIGLLGSSRPGVCWAAHQIDRAYSQIERLVNLHLLPTTGFEVMCFPLKILHGSASPARVVAVLND